MSALLNAQVYIPNSQPTLLRCEIKVNKTHQFHNSL
jgi:hypothetical protein